MNLTNPLVKVGLVAGGSLLLMTIIYFTMSVSYSNSEIDLRQQIEAQQDNSKITFDTVWKTIKQQAQVTDTAKDGFKDVYSSIMSDRYGDEGVKSNFMLWMHESNPDFDMSMYRQLMSTIEAQRKSFQNEQKMLIDLKREHDALLQKFPSSWFVGDREPMEITIVTSDKTKSTFTTGEENDVNVFE